MARIIINDESCDIVVGDIVGGAVMGRNVTRRGKKSKK